MTAESDPTSLLGDSVDGAPARVLALFDALPPVPPEAMTGGWRGSGLPTGHPLDGLLEAYGWHGKRFEPSGRAHPLVFADPRGRFAVDPAWLPLRLLGPCAALLRDRRVAAAGRRVLRLRRTHRPVARLRLTEYRGVPSATMAYDSLPIEDHFRVLDAGQAGRPTALIGVMEARGIEPFFFVLRREVT